MGRRERWFLWNLQRRAEFREPGNQLLGKTLAARYIRGLTLIL